MMNFTKLFVTLISISFVNPASINACKDTDCNILYMPTTARITSCNCTQHVQSFSYPNGYNTVYVNYSVTYPIMHEFYQDHQVIGSCPTGLLCTQRVNFDPTKELTTIIWHDHDLNQEEKPVLYSNDNYELFFDTL